MYRYARNIDSSSFSDLFDDLVLEFFRAALANLADEVNHKKFLVAKRDTNRGSSGIGADCGLEVERDGQRYQIHIKVTNDGQSLKIMVTPLTSQARSKTNSKIVGLYERTADEVAWNASQLLYGTHLESGFSLNN